MARPKLGDGETERLHVKITADELAAIDKWRFQNRVSSRSEAVRRLCQIGILVEGELEAIVDASINALTRSTVETREHLEDTLTIAHGAVDGQKFRLEEVLEVLWHTAGRMDRLADAIVEVQERSVALHNAIASLVEASTVTRGTAAASQRLQEARQALVEAAATHQERLENRYLNLVMAAMSIEDWSEYKALPEEAQEEFLTQEINRFKAEETADPVEFAKVHDLERFWQKSNWPFRKPKTRNGE